MARPRKELEVDIQHTNDDVPIPLMGELNRDDLRVQEVEVCANVHGLNEKAKALAFYEEPVTIFLHETTDPAADRVVFCAVNGEGALGGRNKWLPRGREYTLKRKFVAQLVTTRETKFSQPFKDALQEEKVNYMRPHTAQRYPFSMVYDANPEGAKWLQALMGR